MFYYHNYHLNYYIELHNFIKDDKQEEILNEAKKEQELNEEKNDKVNASNLTSEENNSELMTDRKLWIPITNNETDFDYTKSSEKESVFRSSHVKSILKVKGKSTKEEERRNSKKKLSSKQSNQSGVNTSEFIKRRNSKKPSGINNILSFLTKKNPTQITPEHSSKFNIQKIIFLKIKKN